MIQQVHLAIFRDWTGLKIEQKRSAVSLMEKLVADWQEKYRTRMALMDAVVNDLKDMPLETVCNNFPPPRSHGSAVHQSFEYCKLLETFKMDDGSCRLLNTSCGCADFEIITG